VREPNRGGDERVAAVVPAEVDAVADLKVAPANAAPGSVCGRRQIDAHLSATCVQADDIVPSIDADAAAGQCTDLAPRSRSHLHVRTRGWRQAVGGRRWGRTAYRRRRRTARRRPRLTDACRVGGDRPSEQCHVVGGDGAIRPTYAPNLDAIANADV